MAAQLRNAVSKAGPLARRTVHIKMYPTAVTFSERYEVLKVLEGFGQVQWFKSLKHDARNPVSNAFLSIFETEEAAQSVINSSPIRYKIIHETPRPSPPRPPFSDDADITPPLQPSTSEEKEFELSANLSTYPHESHITSAPLYGPWPPKDWRFSRVVGDLWERIPISPARAGLCDWESAKQIMGVKEEEQREKETIEERAMRKKLGIPAEAGGGKGVPWRLLKKQKQVVRQGRAAGRDILR